MKILAWAVRLVVFLFLFAFAVQNTEPANLRLLLGQVWQLPLAIVVLISFAGGALLGVLSLLGAVFRQRREISRLRRELGKSPMPLLVEPPPSA